MSNTQSIPRSQVATKKHKKQAPLKASTVIIWALILLGALLTLFPVLFMFGTSLKASEQAFVTTWEISDYTHIENYINAFERRPFFRYFANSMIVALATTFISLAFCSMAGYSFAKFKFPGRNVLFVLVLTTLMIPLEVIVIPLYLVVRTFGWIDSYWGLILPVAVNPVGVFLMRQFFVQIPDDYFESARIDGGNEIQIFLKIALPLCGPALTALAIFSFVTNWNSYLWPLIVTNSDALRTLPLGVALFENEAVSRYNEIMAISLAGAIPLVLLFLVLQRHFIEGVVITGLKE